LIVASDKTTPLKVLNRQQVYPVYLTLGNISKDIWCKPSYCATVLLVYLPVERFKAESPVDQTRLKWEMLHDLMKIILEPLKAALQDRVEMWCADSHLLHIYPMLAAFEGDWPEQCDACSMLGSGCLMCDSKLRGCGDILRRVRMRMKRITIEALQLYETSKDNEILADHMLRGYCPFWLDLPFVNLHAAITPDLLHQIYAGMYKDHIKKWSKQLVGETRLDRRFQVMMHAQGIWYFSDSLSGIRMWTGQESKEMAKVLLSTLVGAVNTQVVSAVRSLLDFGYLAHMASMTDEDLTDMDQVLQEFHQHKSALVSKGIMMFTQFDDIPKLHMILHYTWSICQLGTPDGYSTKSPESLHTEFVKTPWRKTSMHDPIPQMVKKLECQEATHIQKTHLTNQYRPKMFSQKVPTTFIVTRDDDGESDSDNEDRWEEVENSEGNTSNSGVVYPNPVINVARMPKRGHLHGSQIVEEYDTTDLI
jgi:hypothetical protein